MFLTKSSERCYDRAAVLDLISYDVIRPNNGATECMEDKYHERAVYHMCFKECML